MILQKICIISGLILFIGTVSCVPRLTDRGATVQVAPDEVTIKDCRFRGSVTGSASKGLSKDQDVKGALNEVRNKSALLGANTVLVVSSDSLFENTVIKGLAYDCPESKPSLPLLFEFEAR